MCHIEKRFLPKTALTAQNQLRVHSPVSTTAFDIQFVSDPQRTNGGKRGHFKKSQAHITECLEKRRGLNMSLGHLLKRGRAGTPGRQLLQTREQLEMEMRKTCPLT